MILILILIVADVDVHVAIDIGFEIDIDVNIGWDSVSACLRMVAAVMMVVPLTIINITHYRDYFNL